MKYILAIIILIFTTTLIAQAQVTVDADVQDDFPQLMLLGLVMVGVIFVGTLIAVGILLAIFLMVTLGILSASVILGIYTRSLATGKKFFVTCYIGACVLFGGTILWAVNYYLNLYNAGEAIVIGVVLGLVAGLASGLILFYYLKRLPAWLRSKITIQTIPK
jgi:hypothetical protein